jgi:hypothetical protein
MVRVRAYTPSTAAPGKGTTFLSVSGTGFVPTAQIFFNDVSIETDFDSGSNLVARLPDSLLTYSGLATVRVDVPCCSGAANDFSLSLLFPICTSTMPTFTYDFYSFPVMLAWDATRGLLYAVPLSRTSILVIDPSTGKPSTVAQTGEIDGIFLSDQDQFFYTLSATAHIATRYTLPGFTNPTQMGDTKVLDVLPAPGLPETVALGLADGSLVIMDGTTPRPNTLPVGSQHAAWGFDSSTLYVETGGSPLGDPATLQSFTVDANGIALNPTGTLSSNFSGRFIYDRALRRLYGLDDGANLDEQGNSHGNFALPTDRFGRGIGCLAAADGANGKVFFSCGLPGEGVAVTINSFDADTSAALDTLVLDSVNPAGPIVRWGSNGLATASGNQMFVYTGAFVH